MAFILFKMKKNIRHFNINEKKMLELSLTEKFIKESNATNSNLEKMEVIRSYANEPILLKVLQYTYDTFKQYGVTSSTCKKKFKQLCDTDSVYPDIFSLLDNLASRKLSGHLAIQAVNGFVHKNKKYKDTIWKIIDRNLKTRSTVSMINQVFENLIPTIGVALANSYNEKTMKNVCWEDEWMISRKLDGVRCITIIDHLGNITFISRQGKEFKTLNNLHADISLLGLKNTVFDGEVCIVDENDKENFSGIIKEIKRKNHTIPNPLYYVFDMLKLSDFYQKMSNEILGDRLKRLGSYLDGCTGRVRVLPQVLGTTDIFSRMSRESEENGWEGLMLRKNTYYKGKRSNDILKVKKMHDSEYVVIDVENSIHRVIVDGKEVSEMMLKNVIIEHKGTRVQVGSGFSHNQRRFYYENPNAIIGKQVTVQYFEETTNKNGAHSLRFPVIKNVYENGNRDV